MAQTIEEKKVKKGIKSTEFWLTLISSLITIVGALQGVIPAKTAAIILAVLNGIYTTMRSVIKIVAQNSEKKTL